MLNFYFQYFFCCRKLHIKRFEFKVYIYFYNINKINNFQYFKISILRVHSSSFYDIPSKKEETIKENIDMALFRT